MNSSIASTQNLAPTATTTPANRHRLAVLLGGVLSVIFLGLLVQMDMHLLPDLTPPRTLGFILLDLAALLMLMAYVVVARATLLWRRARSGMIGTRLQSRIVMMFCVIAILPTISVSMFSAFFFNVGIKSWFDTRVSSALQDSVKVAAAYLDEHKGAIRTDALSMAVSITPQLAQMMSNPPAFRRTISELGAAHNLSEVVVFDERRVLARTALSFSLIFERMPEEVLQRANAGNVVVFGEDQDKIQAVIKISDLPTFYLMIGRVVDPSVLEHMESARTTVAQYQAVQRDIARLQKQFFLVFVLVALLVLLASVWAGMMLAVRLVEPLGALMSATERVRAGDYSSKVVEGPADDEIANLGRTFNRMTGQLDAQRRDLMEANRLLDERRRFTEAVLSGVSAGIVAVDEKHRVTLHNRTAMELLGLANTDTMLNRPIGELLPAVAPLLAQATAKPDRVASGNIVLDTPLSNASLHVQVTAERLNETIEGFIVTFDDITALVSAQRSAAWADVARRIAHEIKNPLTPITLSVERLRKKFGDEINSDRESYDRYLDTIGRHTKDIGRMVEEFVSFARMPTPTMRDENLVMLLRKSVFSEQTVHPEIRYVQTLPPEKILIRGDEGQLGQMFTNLMKNAAEALEQNTGEKEILIALTHSDNEVTVTISDNGPGFPPDKMAQLMEPYVTTRAKGTGLGLAIVKRTMEEHKGTLTLSNREQGGACVTITFEKA